MKRVLLSGRWMIPINRSLSGGPSDLGQVIAETNSWRDLHRILARESEISCATYRTCFDHLNKINELKGLTELYSDMREKKCSLVDSKSFSLLLVACKLHRCSELAQQVLADMDAATIPVSPTDVCLVLETHAILGQTREAVDLFHERFTDPSPRAFNAVLNSCRVSKDWRISLMIFDKMIGSTAKPDRLTFNFILAALAYGAPMEKAEQIFECMVDMGMEPNDLTFEALLNHVAASADDGALVKVVEWMQKYPNAESERTEDALLRALCRIGRVDDANFLYQSMLHRGVVPTLVHINHLLNACAMSSHPTGALQLLESMLSNGLKPNQMSFEQAMLACETAEDATTAQSVWKISRDHIEPSRRVLTSFFRALKAGQEADVMLELLDSAQQLEGLTNQHFILTIDTLATSHRFSEALTVLSDASQRGFLKGSHPRKRTSETQEIDLHGWSVESGKVLAFAATCHALSQERVPTLVIITGRGRRSSQGPVLFNSVGKFINEHLKLPVRAVPNNPGAFAITSQDLERHKFKGSFMIKNEEVHVQSPFR